MDMQDVNPGAMTSVSQCNAAVQESALLKLAGKQAAREEELNRMRERTLLLEAEVADLQQEVDLRQQQEVALKEVSPMYRHTSYAAWWLLHDSTKT